MILSGSLPLFSSFRVGFSFQNQGFADQTSDFNRPTTHFGVAA
jgi:hypothetical protein